jgi:O-antigen/teichoic acid export membrane protein
MINSKSIRNNFGANGLTVIFNTAFQLISVPIFLSYWGIDLYSDWLVLLSLTSYFAMSDIGLNTVTTNEFCISYSQNKFKKCNTLFNNNLFFILIVFTVLFTVIVLFFSFANLSTIFKLESINETTSETIVVCLAIQVFAGMVSGLFDAIYRATNRNALGIMLNNYVRIFENVLLIVGVLFNFNLITIILIYIIPRPVGLIFKVIKTQYYFPLSINLKYFDLKEFKSIVLPAFSFLSFPVGNSIVLQGFTLLVNFTLGSVAVVTYNTTRTLINFVKVGFGLINNSVWPELSLAYGRKDYVSMKKIHRYSVSISFYFSLFASFFLLIFGEFIYTNWTNNKLDFNMTLYICFLITLVANTVWYTSSVVLASTNNHKVFSMYYLISCFVSLLLGYFIITYTNTINYLPLSLLIIDILLIILVLKSSLKIVNDNFSEFIFETLKLPIITIKNMIKK